MREHFLGYFPDLKDRPAFVRQSANLWHVKAWMQQWSWPTCKDTLPLVIIDTLLTDMQTGKAIHTQDRSLSSPPRQKASVPPNKKPLKARITLWPHCPSSHPKRMGTKNCRAALLDGTMGGTTVLADAAFMDLDWQKTCWKTYRIRIKTPIKSNMKENPERAPHFSQSQESHKGSKPFMHN